MSFILVWAILRVCLGEIIELKLAMARIQNRLNLHASANEAFLKNPPNDHNDVKPLMKFLLRIASLGCLSTKIFALSSY
ncbi:MAG: hypothetical protein VSS75_005605 [Candidatus Parabeggiatoa sp.]|nr:hypothetical protein [Candidatus Parabeggiatoa sp.]